MMLSRRGLLSYIVVGAAAVGSTPAVISKRIFQPMGTGLATPHFPQGANGSPAYRPNSDIGFGSAGRVQLDNVFDYSECFCFLGRENRWSWGISVNRIEPVFGDSGMLLGYLPR
jgi:hypothetical protein